MTFNKPVGVPHDVSDLPNISFVLHEQLRHAGITTPTRLRQAGAEAAWSALFHAGRIPSLQTLFALEGAIQNMSWRDLPAGRRIELMRYGSSHSNGLRLI